MERASRNLLLSPKICIRYSDMRIDKDEWVQIIAWGNQHFWMVNEDSVVLTYVPAPIDIAKESKQRGTSEASRGSLKFNENALSAWCTKSKTKISVANKRHAYYLSTIILRRKKCLLLKEFVCFLEGFGIAEDDIRVKLPWDS
ncbi:hypothetical protein NHQ30_010171 [Ciborinia camelliae]|nr:hypothetical protein NHQ30_010171 [Ciborinia camelliae]